jgi:hypothetical protein
LRCQPCRPLDDPHHEGQLIEPAQIAEICVHLGKAEQTNPRSQPGVLTEGAHCPALVPDVIAAHRVFGEQVKRAPHLTHPVRQ